MLRAKNPMISQQRTKLKLINGRSSSIYVRWNKKEWLMNKLKSITQIRKAKRMIGNSLFRVSLTKEKLKNILKRKKVKINFMQKIIVRNKKKG